MLELRGSSRAAALAVGRESVAERLLALASGARREADAGRGPAGTRDEPATSPALQLAPLRSDEPATLRDTGPTARPSDPSTEGVGGAQRDAARAEAIRELVERVQVWLRRERPALAFTLRGSVAAEVRIERTGPRTVSVSLEGRATPLPAALETELRRALAEQGLGVTRLRVR